MKTYEIEHSVLTEQPTAVMRATLSVPEISGFLGRAFGETAKVLGEQHAGPAGPPFARYHVLGDDRFEVEAGFPSLLTIVAAGDVEPSALPAGTVASTIHVGPYDEMQPGYAALLDWISENGFESAGDPWEVYFDDPSMEPDPKAWRTQIVAPYRPRS